MDRQEQLQILWNHENTENITTLSSPEIDKKMFKVGYDIGSLYALLELGYKIRTFKRSDEIEPHRVDLFCPSGKYSFTVKIPTAPMAKWNIGRRDWTHPGTIANAPTFKSVEFECPVDEAHLKIKAQSIIESICKKEDIPYMHYSISFEMIISNLRYKREESELIASSLTDTIRHGWFISNIGELPEWENPQSYKETF